MKSVTLALIAAVGALVVAPAADGATKTRGKFQTIAAGVTMGLDIEGIAQLTRTEDSTIAKVVVRGLEPGRTYAAHLHNAPCAAPLFGGGHYQNVVGGLAAPPNELWLSSTDDPTAGITADDEGVAVGFGRADWVAREEAVSIVIHFIPEGGTTAGGPKIACADLA